jgi:hypothetical protein
MNMRIGRLVALVGVGLLGLALVGPGARLVAAPRPGSTANVVAGQSGLSCADWRSGSGMMGTGSSGGMMGGAQGGLSAMGRMSGTMGTVGMMGTYNADARPVGDARARQVLDAYAASCGNGVAVHDVVAFANIYYGALVDAAGNGYLEVLVDRFTGAVYPEPQSMMWNTTSGMHVGQGTARYDQAAAQQLATAFLIGYLPGATVTDATAFPGYDTFDFGTDAAHPVGMLSVNASTGEVWVHTWHGPDRPRRVARGVAR